MTVTVRLSEVTDFAELAVRWRDLERRAEASFFQTWTWVGCRVRERFSDPVLVEAMQGDRTLALALFNRVPRRIGPPVLYLGATGHTDYDSPYVEQNGVLCEAGGSDLLTRLCLRAVAGRYVLVLPGVGEPVVAAARCVAARVRVEKCQPSPYVDLNGVRRAGQGHMADLSANTRQQVRRSDRCYERIGRIRLEQAHSIESAYGMLDEMAMLHQATWRARGWPGSFARPFFRSFHRELIAAAMPRGEVALLQVSCGDTVIGILYNFVHAGRMLAYQSGLAYPVGEACAKPGLTCHCRAIRAALEQGLERYDFLSGEARYKRSLAREAHRQIWARSGPFWSPTLVTRDGGLSLAAQGVATE